jgi:K+ transporter
MFNVRVQYAGSWRIRTFPKRKFRARASKGFEIHTHDATYFLGRETINVTRREGMAMWREKLFVLLAAHAVRATAFFRLPPERVVELGVQVEMLVTHSGVAPVRANLTASALGGSHSWRNPPSRWRRE